jgi:hypothetical protein
MSKYYNKYIKYKGKYLTLKQQIAGETKSDKLLNEKYINTLKEYYPQIIHDKNDIKDVELYKETGSVITYGEMEYSSIEMFNNQFNNDGQFKYFIDFGSGRGKIPLYMGTKVSERSYGIEIVKERHDEAVELLQRLSVDFPTITKKLKLIRSDMIDFLNILPSNNLEIQENALFTSPTIIWISNLCFTEEMNTRLFQKIGEKMPYGSIIGCSKYPSNVMPENIKPLNVSNGTNTLSVPMTWSKMSTIYIFKVMP